MSSIEYSSGNSFVHTLDPRVKLIALMLLTIVIFIVKNLLVISIMFVSFLSIWLFAELPFKHIRGYFKLLAGLMIFITLMQVLFYPGTNYILNPLIPEWVPLIGGMGSLKFEGLVFGIMLSLRIFTLMLLMPVITMTTPVHILALALVRMGLSYKVAYMITTTANLIPSFSESAAVIMDAQKMRGAKVFEEGKMRDKLKAYPALVVPLIVSAMRKAKLMSVAMDARAFGVAKTKTYVETIAMTVKDYIALVAVILYSAIVLTLNYML